MTTQTRRNGDSVDCGGDACETAAGVSGLAWTGCVGSPGEGRARRGPCGCGGAAERRMRSLASRGHGQRGQERARRWRATAWNGATVEWAQDGVKMRHEDGFEVNGGENSWTDGDGRSCCGDGAEQHRYGLGKWKISIF